MKEGVEGCGEVKSSEFRCMNSFTLKTLLLTCSLWSQSGLL